MRSKLLFCITAIAVSTFFADHAWAQTASGGPYAITQSVIAAGGSQESAGSGFKIASTIGQPVAGQTATGQGFSLYAGFWNADLQQSAVPVSVTGRVTTSTGRGILNVRVTITDSSGASRSTYTASFGYFRFNEIQIGTYTVSVTARRFQFAAPSQTVFVSDQLSDLAFVALP